MPVNGSPVAIHEVSWGVELGTPEAPERILFTHIAVTVMTRLKQPERQVLDTLVDAGVARSRSDGLAWSVRLVGEHAEEWLSMLRRTPHQGPMPLYESFHKERA